MRVLRLVALLLAISLSVLDTFQARAAQSQKMCRVEDSSARDYLVITVEGPNPTPYCQEWLREPGYSEPQGDVTYTPPLLCAFRIGDYVHTVYYSTPTTDFRLRQELVRP